MQRLKTFLPFNTIIMAFIAMGAIGGCGGTDEDNGKTIEVSGDILFFETGIPPAFPLFVRDCLDLIADDGTVYELVVTPPEVRLQSGMRITGLLTIVKKQGFLDFQECGEDKTAHLIEVFERTCVREGGIEDICLTPDAGCCPVEGCTPKLTDCPIPSCPPNQKPCGPYCMDIDDTCCPDPDFLGESCTAGLVCCPKCPETQSGNDCADTLDDCFCRGPLPPIVEKFATVIDVSEIELETRDPEIPPFNTPCPKSNVDLRLDIELRWNNEEPPPPPRPGQIQGVALGLANLIGFDMIGPTDDFDAFIVDGVIDTKFVVTVDDGRPFLAPDMLIADYVNIRFDSFVGTLLDTNEDQIIDTIEVIASGYLFEQAGETRVCDGFFTTELRGDLEQQ